jgi:hypothetical protein
MTELLPVKSELQIFVDGGCRGHRNRRHIADSQVAGSNVGNGASSSGSRLTLVSLKLPIP